MSSETPTPNQESPQENTESKKTDKLESTSFWRRKTILDWLFYLREASQHEMIIIGFLAIFVGFLGGGAAIAFREAIDSIQYLFYGIRSEEVNDWMRNLPWWHILLAPTIGGAIVGLFVKYMIPERRAYGVADVIEVTALHGGRMSIRRGLSTFFVNAVTLGCGGSAGREGPVVHFAAMLADNFSRRLHLGRPLGRTLLGCGVASGVAASFNAPFAGIFFAMEVVTGNYALSSITPVVISAVSGTLIHRAYYGDMTAFVIPEHAIASMLEFPAFALLGLVSAIMAISLVWSIGVAQSIMTRFPIPRWTRPMAGGFAIGIIALAFPQILGVGYETTDQALREELTLSMLLVLIVVKTAATSITLGSGFGGGIFSPSLFLGAMVGGAFGLIATEVFPDLSSGHGAYTIVGMGAVAGAVLGAPMSTILMIFELTGDYALTVAVMISTVIASQIMVQVFGHSFFSWQLMQRGINVSGGRESTLLRNKRVKEVMRDDFITIQPDAGMQEIREKLQACPYGELFMVDENGVLRGTIMLQNLAEGAFDKCHDKEWNAQVVARKKPPAITEDRDLEQAISFMEGCGEEHVAVVDSKESGRLIGVLHERHVMAEYHHAVLDARDTHRKDYRS
ncbi:chloride channel protein [Curvivirga sp.]|uniref:chloride channel protein n=1 Tax=Curvivirga sp. TaxID=2856848 RepID=UPI003B5CB30B